MKLKALVLAAGEGTRMRSNIPKVFHKVAGIPILYRVLQALAPLTSDIAVVLGRDFQSISTRIHDAFPDVETFEQDQRLGTGHAVQIARTFYENPDTFILIVPGDLPLMTNESLREFVECCSSVDADCGVLGFEPEDPTGYGRILSDNGHFVSIVEEKDASDQQKQIRLVNGGVYLFRADLLARYITQLDNQNAQQEYYLTDLPAILVKEKHAVCVARAQTDKTDDFHGVNNRIQLAHVDRIAIQRKRESLMLNGVTLFNPESIRIEESVEIAADTVIYGPAQLLGQTAIGMDTTIHAGAIIQDARIGDKCTVLPYSVVIETTVEADCSVGPMAHLRPGTHLGSHVKIGNFVETKNARIQSGVKASHLSYLGDTDIGANTNIGAGTITCNYDGERKHKTIMGKNVFIGSDSQLVAPVTIGDNSYVGAGSTITKDVPPCSLAISRARQTNIKDWPKKKGKKCNQS